jgi:hypothetical protein
MFTGVSASNLRTVNAMRIPFKLLILAATCLLILVKTGGATSMAFVRDAAGGVDRFNQPGGFFLEGNVLNNAGKISGAKTPAGTFSLELSFDNPNGPYLPLLTYCADPFLPLTVGPVSGTGGGFEVRSMEQFGFSSTVVNAIELLWANAFQEALGSPVRAAAFQFMIWELVADVNAGLNFNLSGGSIRTNNSSVLSQIATWNSALATWTRTADLQILDGRDAGKQSLFVEGTAGVPEPSTYFLMGCGLVGLVWARRKARR